MPRGRLRCAAPGAGRQQLRIERLQHAVGRPRTEVVWIEDSGGGVVDDRLLDLARQGERMGLEIERGHSAGQRGGHRGAGILLAGTGPGGRVGPGGDDSDPRSEEVDVGAEVRPALAERITIPWEVARLP